MWYRVFCRSAAEVKPADLLVALQTPDRVVDGRFTGDDLGWTAAEFTVGQGTPIHAERYLTTEDELAWLTELYEYIYAPENAGEPGAPIDRTNGEGTAGPAYVSQAFFPELYYPQLLHTTYRRNARRYAAWLLGVRLVDVKCWFHLIR